MSVIDKTISRDTDVPKNVQLYAVDTANNLIPVRTDLSGQLSVDVNVGDVIAVVSGPIYLLSGEVHVISGQVISKTSGEVNRVAIYEPVDVARLSGQAGLIKTDLNGELVAHASINSGLVGVLSGQVGILSGEVHILSGQLISKVSGEIVSVASGAEILWRGVQISGAVIISGDVGVSGSVTILNPTTGVIVSGSVSIQSGEVHILSGIVISKVSGEVVKIQVPTSLNAGYVQISNISGGVQIASGPIVSVRVKNVNVSGRIWVGPPGINSGAGYLIGIGDDVPLEIGNLNLVYSVAEISGDYVSYIAEVE